MTQTPGLGFFTYKEASNTYHVGSHNINKMACYFPAAAFNKLPQNGQLKTINIYSHTAQEARSPKPVSRAPFRDSRGGPSCPFQSRAAGISWLVATAL